jgi:hypothetical protein
MDSCSPLVSERFCMYLYAFHVANWPVLLKVGDPEQDWVSRQVSNTKMHYNIMFKNRIQLDFAACWILACWKVVSERNESWSKWVTFFSPTLYNLRSGLILFCTLHIRVFTCLHYTKCFVIFLASDFVGSFDNHFIMCSFCFWCFNPMLLVIVRSMLILLFVCASQNEMCLKQIVL